MTKNSNPIHANQKPAIIPWLEKYSIYFLALLSIVIRVLDGMHVPLNMDEIPILFNVAHFIKNHTILPSHFSYPTFYSYLITPLTVLFFLLDYLLQGFPVNGLLDFQWLNILFTNRMSVLMFSGRLVSILCSALIVVYAFDWTKKQYGITAALIASSILVFDPCGGRWVAFSRLCVPDVASTLFVTIGIFVLLDYLHDRNPNTIFFSAFFIGLAINTKYNSGMALIPFFFVLFRWSQPVRLKTILGGFLFLALGFCLASPGWIIQPNQYINGFLYEARHMAFGHLGENGKDWIWIFLYLKGIGTWILPIILFTVGYSFWKHQKEDAVFLLFILSSFVYIGQFEKKAIHYFLFLYPVLAVFIGRALSRFGGIFKAKWIRWLYGLAIFCFIAVNPAFRLTQMIHRDMRIDNRTIAVKWIQKNVPSDKSLIVDRNIFSELLDREEMSLNLDRLRKSGSRHYMTAVTFYRQKPVYSLIHLQELSDDTTNVRDTKADYFILSSINYLRFFTKDPNNIPNHRYALYESFQKKKLFYSYILKEKRHGFHRIKAFQTITGPEVLIFQKTSIQ